VETHDEGERKWYFQVPSAVSEATHDGSTVLVHLGLFSGIRRLIEDVTTFHAWQNIILTSQETTSFYSRRPDGVAFDAKSKNCVFLEFTRPMDSVTSSDEGDWAEIRELEKNERYGMHIYFIYYLSVLHGRPLNCTQANFTVGACGYLKRTQFQDRLCLLEMTDSKAREKIRVLKVSKTLALSDIILKLFHASILCSPEWALSSLPTELANCQTSAFKLFKKFTGRFSGLVIGEERKIGPLSLGRPAHSKGRS